MESRRVSTVGVVVATSIVLVLGLLAVRILPQVGGAATTVGGLSVSVAYAEDKEIETPDPAAFPVPWAGAPNTTFLGGTVPGQAACGTLTTCYDAGAIRLDNPGTSPVTVSNVSVDDHSSLPGGKVFNNLWGSFTVAPGQSVILTENPPTNNPVYDNFDTSSFPPSCTPIPVAPTVTITIGGVPTTLADSTHVLDSGATDAGSCSPKHNESVQWRATFAYAGTQGEDLVVASVTTVGSFSSAPVRVLWTDPSAAGWTGSDIGGPPPAGSQSFQSGTGAWTVSGSGAGIGGTSDQFHFVQQAEPTNGGVAARVVSLGGSASSQVGVMLRCLRLAEPSIGEAEGGTGVDDN